MLQLIHNAILKQWQCLMAFLYLGIALTSSASRREELERVAELAVEKAAERAAERAVEKALDSGNVTTESKLVRESYFNVQKENPRKEKQKDEDYDDDSEYPPVDDEVQPKEDIDDWNTYIRGSRFTSKKLPGESFRAWSSKLDFRNISDIWKKYPRSEWSQEDVSADQSGEKDVTEKSVSVPVAVERRIPYSVYKHVPYEIKVSVPQFYTLKKRVPVKIYLNVPELYQIERRVPYEMKISNPASYGIAESISRSYAVDKPVDYEVKALIDIPVEKKAPVAFKVAMDQPVPYPQRIKVEKPYAVERSVPVAVKISDSRPYAVKKPVPIQVVKPYSVPIKVDKVPYEVQQARPMLVPVRKSISYAPVPANLNRKDRANASKDKEAVTESEDKMVNAVMEQPMV